MSYPNEPRIPSPSGRGVVNSPTTRIGIRHLWSDIRKSLFIAANIWLLKTTRCLFLPMPLKSNPLRFSCNCFSLGIGSKNFRQIVGNIQSLISLTPAFFRRRLVKFKNLKTNLEMHNHQLEGMAASLEQAGFGTKDAILPVLAEHWKHQIAVVWHVDDVKQVVEEQYEGHTVSDEDAMLVLERVFHSHDATIGVSWDVFEICVVDMFEDGKITLLELEGEADDPEA